MANTDLGYSVNSALKEIGEPAITAFDADNILQQMLIEEANDTVTEIMTYGDFRWALKHVNVLTAADITTDSAAVTNGSATVTSVDSDAVAADSFTGATTDMWFRRNNDNVSYPISAVDTASSPDTLTLGTSAATGSRAYVGDTSTAAAYRIFQDTYDLTDATIDEIKHITFGDASGWANGLSGQLPANQIDYVNMQTVLNASGGDLHRNTSGRPRLATLIANDADENQRILLWPFPTSQYLIDIWYKELFSENTTFTTNLFGGDAPAIAYQAVSHRVKMRACTYDEDYNRASLWEQRYQAAIGHLMRRENRAEIDSGFSVNTYRQHYGVSVPTSSNIYFDIKGASR